MTKKPELNPDGVSVKGCKIIYAPKGQAGEYAPLATNPFTGCGHKCRYCYVPHVLKIDRPTFDAQAVPRKDYLKRLTADAIKYQQAGIREQVMLSFTTDPYNPFDVETQITRQALVILRSYGLGFCTLTKGGRRALRDIDLFRPHRDAFATTLTSLDPEFSLKWEPGAAEPADRIATLREFHDRGIYTWVSLEPVLDTKAALEIIQRTRDFVDLYKIGRANYLPMTKVTDWKTFTYEVVDLCTRLGVRHYIKKDLQPYLPEGYHNPLRVEQFRRSEQETVIGQLFP
jgi:DNA repair photolyase